VPIFFDPDEDEPREPDPRRIMAATIIGMIRAGSRERLICAFVRTGGLLPNETGYANMLPSIAMLPSDRAEWDSALAEFECDFPADPPRKA
jgi:hypothetical protein